MDFIDGRPGTADSAAPAPPATVSGPRARLSREQILRAALQLLDEGGEDALSMRRLATALGVKATSLYHHYEDKAALLDAMTAHLLSQLEPRGSVVGWRGYLEASARGLREALRRHPSARFLFATRPIPWAAVSAQLDAARRRMQDVGIPPAMREQVLESLSALVLGFELGRVNGAGPAADAAFDLALTALLDGLEAARNRLRR